MFRYALLGSGSRGNATLVQGGATRLLVDCGFTVKEIDTRSARIDFDPASIDAILVTHEHTDHIGGVARLARAYGIPVLLTPGTASTRSDWDGCTLRHISPHQSFTLGEIEVHPFPVPHDAREPCHFAFAHGGRRLGIVSDLGRITPHVVRSLNACDALLLECNHDVSMLARGPYPESLKRRVGGDWGHLSNAQAAGLLREVDRTRLQALVLTHLSEKNNTPALARAAACEALQDDPDWCICAEQDQGSGWHDIA
ncbi:MAG: MBL fold metallo-hydrolase [Panacagrimonas sp.]